MKDREWSIIRRCAECETMDRVPVGLIVDSPWIPGYVGVSTVDYYTDMNVFLTANKAIKKDFPGLLFLPDYWVEFGMAAEPSGFGCKPNFYDYQPVNISHLIHSADDIEQICNLPVPDPYRDGLLPLVLNYYKKIRGPLAVQGESIRMVASRGPLNIAAHMMSVPEFLVALKIDPDNTHKLLKTTTQFVIRWLEAQAECQRTVEGILVLDDIVGFLSEEDYMEFAHPYLKEIFGHFHLPVRMFHNDNHNPVSFPHMEDLGINMFNFSHLDDITEARKALGNRICIFGNVSPLDVLTNGTPEQCAAATIDCLNRYGSKAGIILSAGGGTSPGTPGENISAMLMAVNEWNNQ